MWDLLKDFMLWGCLGLLVEVLFTGIKSILRKDRLATCHTYLYMLPIYACAGLSFQLLYKYVPWKWYIHVPLWAVLILAWEYLSGLLLRKWIGVCPWHYTPGKWTLHGLTRLDYYWWWLLLAGAQFYALSHLL